MCINTYLCIAEDEAYSSSKGLHLASSEATGADGSLRVRAWQRAPAESGVLVGQLKQVASLLQALIHVQPPPERLLLLLQLSAYTPGAGDRLFFAFRMENSSTAFTPAKANHGYDEQG